MKISIVVFLIYYTLNVSSISNLSNVTRDQQQYFKKSINLKTKNLTWRYYHPFADKKYILAIAFADQDFEKELTGDEGKNAIIYFGKDDGNKEMIFWKEISFLVPITDNVDYEDYNSDGIKDLVLFAMTGGRGGNAYYHLYLINSKLKTLTKVTGFDDIVNPSFNKKYSVIVSLGLAGENYYSIYKLTKNHKLIKIGKSFKEISDLNLDKKIAKVINQAKK